MKTLSNTVFILTILLIATPLYADKQASIATAELSTIANHLAHRPHAAIDFRDVSGEFCFDVDMKNGGHMTHYAVDPESTEEDVIDFVNAKQLVDSGMDVASLPAFPGQLGTMEQNTWYYLAPGKLDPHHGVKWDFPVMLRASNL
ncbi:MAG: hypothetical protein JKY90_05080 [Gammaproteobacteria bacterium]|nr:hypothetical protein [Gammaproteobacteria bacterium]